jgi:hypothetical protein
MTLVLLLATVVDAAVVAALAWLVRRTERTQSRMLLEQQAVLARLRGELDDLVRDAERRTRALDHALAMREATLRVLLQTTARPAEEEGAQAPGVDPAEVRLLRDLELSLERAAHAPSPES